MAMSQDDLHSAAGEIQYELRMLTATANRLAELAVEQNTYLEGFLIHYRALAEFLESSGVKTSDIKASDYGVTSVPPLPPREDIHQLLAHLTTHRLSSIEESHRWDIQKMHRDIEHAFASFRSALPEERREWFATVPDGGTPPTVLWGDLTAVTTSSFGSLVVFGGGSDEEE